MASFEKRGNKWRYKVQYKDSLGTKNYNRLEQKRKQKAALKLS